jgi:hypothetical protein
MTASSTIDMLPVQWSTLNHAPEVSGVGDSDAACMAEIRSVLQRYNCLDRFGVNVLHSQFELADDEILLETTDIAKREHWIRPVKKSVLAAYNMEPQTTVLRFDNEGWNQHCSCARDIHGHTGGHMG